MSNSKPLPPFTFDLLYYLNRDQLERFSIVCRPLKNFIDRYFHSKPYRVFDRLYISQESYALRNNCNRDNDSVQNILAGEKFNIDELDNPAYYSFAEIRPYLGSNIRIKETIIFVGGDSTYNPEQIEEMESISYLWRNGEIHVKNGRRAVSKIIAQNFQSILNSPTILQCRELYMNNVQFSFKDYQVLYTPRLIQIYYGNKNIDPNSWLEFLEQPGVKPLVVLRHLHRDSVNNVLDQLFKAFSSAVSPNAFKIVFVQEDDPLTVFLETIKTSVPNEDPLTKLQKTNKTSGEILELKKGLLVEYQTAHLKGFDIYSTLERSII
ncbi:hypothetical protein Ddc_19270 [Ditylenchus destructor]|nr:hypothetical protein Ddc_19270 [Ditylenchus destructor]